MDRNVEFLTHLSRLVALYAQTEVDAAAERGALRAARAAAKRGACELAAVDGVMHAGARDLSDAAPDVSAVAQLLTALASRAWRLTTTRSRKTSGSWRW